MNRDTNQEHGALEDHNYRKFNLPGLVAWFVPTVTGILMLQFLGDFGATWGPVSTPLLAALLYYVLRRTTKTDTALVRIVKESSVDQEKEKAQPQI